MRRKVLLALVPLAILVPFLFGGLFDGKGPIRAGNHEEMEKKVGHHLVAPTYLPAGMAPGTQRAGALRVLCDYSNDDHILVVAQEQRSPERDEYHRDRFSGESVDINGQEGVITRGTLGERKLVFSTDDLTILLSSATLSQDELVAVARSLK